MNEQEYLRLPHGMFDRDENWIKRERIILDNHYKSGEKIGCKLKKYSPLGYTSTFIKGVNTTKDKVYTLKSKSQKSLILSCDSTPSVFRNYVTENNGQAQRISFVAPLFRYRNSHSRHFTQIGYSIINEKESDDENLDINLIQLAKAITELFKNNGIKTKICINDFYALREIMKKYVAEKELPEILHKLQFASQDERMTIFETYITEQSKCEQMKQLFRQEPMLIKYKDIKDNKMNLPEEYMGIYKMGEGLSYITNNEVYFDPKDLHSIETIDSFALRFRTLDGVALGDGGKYTNYAQRWNHKIQSFWSVASGVEAIERNSPEIQFDEINRKIVVCNLGTTSEFALRVIKKLEDMGEFVTYKGTITNIGKAIKKAKREDYTHIAVLGTNEENGEDIKIKAISGNESMIIESPNKNIIGYKESNDFEEER